MMLLLYGGTHTDDKANARQRYFHRRFLACAITLAAAQH